MKALGWLGVCSLISAIVLGGARPSVAEESRAFLICIPDGPASTTEVVERLETFLKPLGEALGASVTGEYHTRLPECDRYLASASPSLVLYPLDLFLKRRKAQNLSAVGEPVRAGAAKGISRYHLVAASDATLASVKSGVLMSPHVGTPEFFTRVVFPRTLDLATFQVKRTSSAMRALKQLKKGKAQVVLLDEAEHVAMGELPFAKGFKTLLSSEKMPHAPIAVMGSDAGFRKSAARALTRLCDPGTGAPEACEALEIRSIRAVKSKTYRDLIQRWGR